MRKGRDPQVVAEQLAASWLRMQCAQSIITATRSKFQRQDIWGADVAAFLDDALVLVQVTTGDSPSTLSARRRKLERHQFPETAQVWLMQAKPPGKSVCYGHWSMRVQEFAPPTPFIDTGDGARKWSPWGNWIVAPQEWTASTAKAKKRKSTHRLAADPPAEKMTVEQFRKTKGRSK